MNEIGVLIKNLEDYRNLVLCRADNSQHRAHRLYQGCIRPYVSDEMNGKLSTELSHYMLDEHTPDEFGQFVKEFCESVMNKVLDVKTPNRHGTKLM